MTIKEHVKRDPAKTTFWLCLAFVIATSFFTYVWGYWNPPHPFWDEPYHIASAEKYLHGVFFMEQHPPLGKLLIALGEKIVHPNAVTDQFIYTDYARDFPEGFSFAGFRLFPTLLAWLAAPLLFFIFLYITRSPILSTLLSFLYIFDNAEIVHSRGAMVDSPLTFFALCAILIFFHIQSRRGGIRRLMIFSLLFGIAFACALTTKVVALILVLLIPAAIIRLIPDWRKVTIFVICSFLAFFATYVAVWETHFTLGGKIVPELSNSGYYEASDETKSILDGKKNSSIGAFPILLKDALAFVDHYNAGVPRLDLCKADENGSPAFLWPVGARTINYRWEKPDDTSVRYLYLVSNPIGWAIGLLGVILAVSLLLTTLLGEHRTKLNNGYLLLTIGTLYGGYMVAISTLDRVMYLYHYFLPLLFSFILFALALENVHRFWKWSIDEHRRVTIMTVLGLLIFTAFHTYRPFSYYEPMTKEQVERRAILPIWELTCVGCEKVSPLVVPGK